MAEAADVFTHRGQHTLFPVRICAVSFRTRLVPELERVSVPSHPGGLLTPCIVSKLNFDRGVLYHTYVYVPLITEAVFCHPGTFHTLVH